MTMHGNGNSTTTMDAEVKPREQTHGTSDLAFAAWLVAQGYEVTGLTGQMGKRIFLFDRPIPSGLFFRFNTSPEKVLLDAYRTLKVMALRHV